MSQNVVLISASPRVDDTTASGALISMVSDRIRSDNINKTTIDVRHSIIKHQTMQNFETIYNADAIVLAFPLYFFCVPGLLMRFMEDYFHYYKEKGKSGKNPKIYAIVNCGFPEAGINEEAVRVIKSFSSHIGAEFRFAILIGGGGMTVSAKDAPFMKKTIAGLEKAMDLMAIDAINENHAPCEDVLISPNFPRRLYFFMGSKGFTHTARKNGLSKKDICRKPYRAN